MDLSICILTHHQPELLPRCVEHSLAEIDWAGLRGEVVIIDNASFDGSPQAAAARFRGVRVLRNEQNLGFSAANNKAIRISTGRDVLILNDDAILEKDSLRLMVEELDSDPRIAAVGPKLLNRDGSVQRGFTNRSFPHMRGVLAQILLLEEFLERRSWTRKLTMSRDPDLGGDTEHLAGACLLVRRAALDSVGDFDEAFHRWFEDTDLCHRLKDAGWRLVYVPQAHVTHYGTATLSRLTVSERNTLYFDSLKRYFRKHSSSWHYQLVRLAVAAAVLTRATGAVLYSLYRGTSTSAGRRESIKRSLSIVRLMFRQQD
jgi:N-acetylglucosaminyl-diphospho-decaprenol L-rhamnosyltransferase